MTFVTLEQAKEHVRNHWREGVSCPCCNQLVKLYRTKLRGSMVRELIKIYQFSKRDGKLWIHVMKELKPINGDYAKLRYWGLIEEKGDDPGEEKKSSGYWKITHKGIDFVLRLNKVPQYCLIFDSRSWGFEGEEVGIEDCIGVNFNYRELMGAWYTEKPKRETAYGLF